MPGELARPSSGAVGLVGSDREFPRDPHVRVINAATDELIRELTPAGIQCGSQSFRCLETSHMERATGIEPA